MRRKAYGIKNATGEWFYGKAIECSGWTADFSRARIFGRVQDASNCANEYGLAGRGYNRGRLVRKYPYTLDGVPRTDHPAPPTVVELVVREVQHDDATR